MPVVRGTDLFLQSLVARGVKYIFGNPGTTEAPLVDRIASYPQLEYIIALHEGVAVGMADAFALASGQVSVVNLHVAPGLGNGLGMLYNTWVGRSPVIFTAGQEDTRLLLREPLLAHDLVAMAAPLVKWSYQAERADDLPLIMHRAFKIATDPPGGPVFLSLPMNVLAEESRAAALPVVELNRRILPEPAAIQKAARLLAEAQHPLVIYGEAVVRSGTQPELTSVAELLGAPVWTTMIPTGVGFPMNHPQYQGDLPDNHAGIRERVAGADVILLVGGDFFREVFYTSNLPWAEGIRLVHIEDSAEALAKNFAPQVGVLGDLKASLAQLYTALEEAATDESRRLAAARREEFARRKVAREKKWLEEREKLRGQQPMPVASLMVELKRSLPRETVVVAEPLTSAEDLFRVFQFEKAGSYFGSRGGGIGQGLPGALGVRLARPDRPVVCLSGDGSALYSIQALWTAARYRIPVVFIILNNRSYRILKLNLERYRQYFNARDKQVDEFMDLKEPQVDFVTLSRGLGVPGQAVTEVDEIAPAVQKAFESGGPYLLDVLINGNPVQD